jgi:hypothetical protein
MPMAVPAAAINEITPVALMVGSRIVSGAEPGLATN